jgi:hypothetical protein
MGSVKRLHFDQGLLPAVSIFARLDGAAPGATVFMSRGILVGFYTIGGKPATEKAFLYRTLIARKKKSGETTHIGFQSGAIVVPDNSIIADDL